MTNFRHLEEENENSEYNQHEEEIYEEEVISASVLCIFLLLIVLTICFDVIKHYVQDRAGRHMRPIIESLFGELTVLGFLSACTYVFSEIGAFAFLSEKLFGQENEFLELFELVHFSLFFVMLVFVIQVLEEVKQGLQTETEWLRMDRYCRDPDYIRLLLENENRKENSHPNVAARIWKNIAPFLRFLPQMRNKASESLDDMLLFYSLREEFIKERSVDPPFQPTPQKHRLDEEFNFGRYLSVCFGVKMAHVVEVDTLTWACFALFGTALFFMLLVVRADLEVMSIIWVMVGYAVFLFNVYFENHLLDIRKAFVPSSDAVIRQLSAAELERLSMDDKKTPLIDSNTEAKASFPCYWPDLPAWCSLDIEQYERERSWLARIMAGKVSPNRQTALYWLERHGPNLHLLILRLNLVFIGVYCALLALVFLPAMYKKNSIHIFATYLSIAVVPMLAILLNKKHLVSSMVQVGSIGTFRLPQAVAQAEREEKTAQAVRTLVIIQRLHRAAELAASGISYAVEGEKGFREVLSHDEIDEVGRTFHLFDADGSEEINASEFQDLMRMLGAPMDLQSVEKFIFSLDNTADNQISKDEFLQWYASQVGKRDGLSMKQRAHLLFKMFDKDSNGQISVSEFKQTLDNINSNFAVEEVGELVNEMDINGNGVLSEKEFRRMLEMFYPRELDYGDAPWACIICDPIMCDPGLL